MNNCTAGCNIYGVDFKGVVMSVTQSTVIKIGETKGRAYIIATSDRITRIGQLWRHLKQDEVVYYAPAKKLMPCKFFLNHVWTIQALEKHIQAGHFYIYKPLNDTHKIEAP